MREVREVRREDEKERRRGEVRGGEGEERRGEKRRGERSHTEVYR